MEREEQKPHCLILPYPIQGHINPMLQFSKRLSHNGITITLAATKRLLKATREHLPIDSIYNIESISDGTSDGRQDETIESYLHRFQRVGSETLAELLEKLGDSGRPVDCVIYDPFLPWALDVAKKFGLFGAAFFTQSSSVNVIYYNVHKRQLQVPLSGDKEILVPGLSVPLAISDMPSFVRDLETHRGALDLLVNQFDNVERADFVFVNSIYELEQEATDWLAKFMPVKTIGPTIPSMYLDKRLMEDTDYGLSIFTPVNTCMKWLDQRASKSVVYVSFGSMAKLEREQMEELALGLKMANKYFLWVVRSSEESKLPKGFAKESSEKGLIVSWCPQLQVLAHDSISCFVTHCGWNSTLEALSLGVPMVAVPWWSDQSTNAKFVTDVWDVGVRACPKDDDNYSVRGEEIVRCVRYIMEGERGGEIRNNAKKWSQLIGEVFDGGRSSSKNIQDFVSTLFEILSPNQF